MLHINHGYQIYLLRLKQILICFIIVFTLLINSAHAEDSPSYPELLSPNFEGLRHVRTIKIKNVIDTLHIQTSNDRIIFLSGIYIPDTSIYDPSLHEKELFTFLNETIKGQKVDVFQSARSGAKNENILGHDIAHIVRQDNKLWLQGLLIYEGLALAYPSNRFPEMATKMFHLEDLARHRKVGLWADNSFNDIDANKTQIFKTNSYIIVQGKIFRKSVQNNALYLHFTPKTQKGLKVEIKPEIRKAFSKISLNPMQLTSKTIRVRGSISEEDPLVMTLEHPILLEVLSLEDEQDNLAP